MNASCAAVIAFGAALAGCGTGTPSAAATTRSRDPLAAGIRTVDARTSALLDAAPPGAVLATDASTLAMVTDAAAVPDAGGDRADARTDPADAGLPNQPSRPMSLTLDFTTSTQGGRFAPVNGGVAWIADAQGKWVHTLEIWINSELSALAAYTAAGGPNYVFLPFHVPVPPDVVTSATLPRHGAHLGLTWNLRGSDGGEVADGEYRIMIEVAEEKPEHVYAFSFVKAGQPARWTAPDAPGLVGVGFALQ